MANANDLDELEARIAALEPHVARKIDATLLPAEPAPQRIPPRWSFVPRRDDQNLIVEVIATPLTEDPIHG